MNAAYAGTFDHPLIGCVARNVHAAKMKPSNVVAFVSKRAVLASSRPARAETSSLSNRSVSGVGAGSGMHKSWGR